MAIIVRVPYQITDGELTINLPDWISGRSIVEHHDDQTVTVRIHGDQDQIEQWAVEQGYHTPARVDRGRFHLALMAKDADVFAAVKAIVAASEQMELAASIPYYRRVSPTIAGLQAQLQAMGFAQVTDQWVDDLFRDAFLLEL